MKNLKLMLIVAIASIGIVSCADEANKPKVETNQTSESSQSEDDDSGLSFDINLDKDGEVSGGVSGEVSDKK